ncbi:MAG: hypothetical protein RL060_1611 [Bacteroidota bacterium]
MTKIPLLKAWLLMNVFIAFNLGANAQSDPSLKTSKTTFWIDKFTVPGAKTTTGGSWSIANDGGNGGQSIMQQLVVTDTNSYVKYRYALHKGEFKWDPYVMLYLPMVMNMLPITVHPVALAYDFKGANHNVQFQSSEVVDYAYHAKSIAASSEWTTVVIPFTALQQASWGKKVAFSKNTITGINWVMTGKDGTQGEFSIDNVRFLRVLPEATPVLKRVLTENVPEVNTELPATTSPEMAIIAKEVSIADWQGFAKAAYSLTFDDGLLSHTTHLAPILEKHHLKATFFLVSDALQENEQAQASWRYGYWERFKALVALGHEMGAHTCSHAHLGACALGTAKDVGALRYEIQHPLNVFAKWIPNAQVSSFAYPFGEFNAQVKSEVAPHYMVARGVSSGINQPKTMDWMAIHCDALSYAAGRTLASDIEKFKILQNDIVQHTIPTGAWSVYLAHDVLPFEEAVNAKDSWQPVSVESFDLFAAWLAQQQMDNQLWVAPFGTVAKYIKEKNNVTVTYLLRAQSIELNVTDNLVDTQFNVPLSIEVEVPNAWTNIAILQNNQKITPASFNNGKLRLNIVPDAGLLIITQL